VPGDPAQNVLIYFVLPVWLAVGYLCHRAASIATTSGWKKSLLHLFAQPDGISTLAATFLKRGGQIGTPPGTVGATRG
jgi:hypothetical protein